MSELALSPRREVFDSSLLAGGERFDAWRDAVNAAFVPLSVASAEPKNFTGSLICQSMGTTHVSEVCGSASQVRRTAREIAGNDPGLIKLGLQLRGYSVVAQDGREAALTPGDFAIYDTSRPYDLYFDDSFQMLVVMFPPESLQLTRRDIAGLTASRVSGRQGLGSLTSTLLSAMGQHLRDGEVPGAVTVSDALLSLVSAVFAERVDPGSPLNSQRLVLLARVQAYISSHLGDPELTVTAIAATHHVSVRYLQKLFEEHGETVSAWIRRKRLEKCRHDLLNPQLRDRPVSAVGMHWGFTDASSFSRAFKSAFGRAPAEYRYSFSPMGTAVP
ncbi:AraC family transcriptional regulator [Arthrobacter sp. SLBN-100]|uniref:AraC-like ligand-binding domain-containing protein n=1 Tax=Arthrobacter sp. SLBN-100 TaxID=2768450 RepID=UPI001174ED14|nr:helix-turn-helix domain-containing protein [Arthrobacter sp. SLBN-100]TQJ68477.1 AraC family transcriptional regulator [Arthrobacter sp. SLBN-100]